MSQLSEAKGAIAMVRLLSKMAGGAMPVVLVIAIAQIASGQSLSSYEFRVWKTLSASLKTALYIGWQEGWVAGAISGKEVPPGLFEFLSCLPKIKNDQAVAMIDKYLDTHPEEWGNSLGISILQSIRVQGSPCAGILPLVTPPK